MTGTLHLWESPLGHLLAEAAAGRPPRRDGRCEVFGHPPGPVAGLLVFDAHFVVAGDVEPAWVHQRLPVGDFEAPLSAHFLDELADRLDRSYDNLDLVLVAPSAGGPPSLDLVPLDPADARAPARVARSLRYRTDVALYETAGRSARTPGGIVLVGRGLARRWEAAFEVDPEARGRKLGRALATAARHLVPAGEPVFVQVAPGNVSSLRAVLAAGAFEPIGAEVLFAAHDWTRHPR